MKLYGLHIKAPLYKSRHIINMTAKLHQNLHKLKPKCFFILKQTTHMAIQLTIFKVVFLLFPISGG
jgi:hypothetical protein